MAREVAKTAKPPTDMGWMADYEATPWQPEPHQRKKAASKPAMESGCAAEIVFLDTPICGF